MKYKVHIYAVVRCPFEVEAESQEDAVNKGIAEFTADDHAGIYLNPEGGYAGEFNDVLVDELDEDGETIPDNSQCWVWDDEKGGYSLGRAEVKFILDKEEEKNGAKKDQV